MPNPTVKPEVMGLVIVERIMDALAGNNQNYKGLMVRQILKREGADSITSMFLGGDFTEQRVAVQQIHNDQLEKYGIKVGDDLSRVMDVALKVRVTELTQSEYDKLEDREQRGFSAKVNPTTDQELATADGEAIYRRTDVTSDSEGDKKVSHVKTANVAVNASEIVETATVVNA